MKKDCNSTKSKSMEENIMKKTAIFMADGCEEIEAREFDSWILKKVIAGRIKPAMSNFSFYYVLVYNLVYNSVAYLKESLENTTLCWNSSMVIMKNLWIGRKAKPPKKPHSTMSVPGKSQLSSLRLPASLSTRLVLSMQDICSFKQAQQL